MSTDAEPTYTTEEGSHTVKDGTKLYTKTWTLSFGRGWGRSVTTQASKGLTGGSPLIYEDLASFISTHLPSPVPIFLMGHSMGGGIVLGFAADGPQEQIQQFRGLLAESPFLALAPASQASRITVVLGRLAGKLLPHHQMVQKLNPAFLSRDPEVNKINDEDPLCHDTGTLEGLAAMLDRGECIVKGSTVPPATLPIWISHGSADKITGYDASRKWTEQTALSKDKEFKSYEGWYHKLHGEPGEDKYTYAKDTADWILARAGSTTATAGKATEGEDGRAKL
ncbi:MAG: hypothetical protein M1838_001830 [Thelocarpon superellum]|nr:MAG: hypothetical protein M1838_001830 [Thelocarpon superellum]